MKLCYLRSVGGTDIRYKIDTIILSDSGRRSKRLCVRIVSTTVSLKYYVMTVHFLTILTAVFSAGAAPDLADAGDTTYEVSYRRQACSTRNFWGYIGLHFRKTIRTLQSLEDHSPEPKLWSVVFERSTYCLVVASLSSVGSERFTILLLSRLRSPRISPREIIVALSRYLLFIASSSSVGSATLVILLYSNQDLLPYY